jgi:hypothetical protein
VKIVSCSTNTWDLLWFQVVEAAAITVTVGGWGHCYQGERPLLTERTSFVTMAMAMEDTVDTTMAVVAATATTTAAATAFTTAMAAATANSGKFKHGHGFFGHHAKFKKRK